MARFLLICLLTLLGFPSHAYVHKYDYRVPGFSGVYATCDALAAALTSHFGGGSRYCQVTGSTLYVCESPSNCATVSYSQEVITCPEGHTDTGSSCQPPPPICTPPMVYDSYSDACVPPPSVCSELTDTTTGFREIDVVMGNMTPSQMASAIGTTLNVNHEVGGNTCAASGKVVSCGKLGTEVICTIENPTFTGGDPLPEPEAPIYSPEAPPKSCPTGQCPGTVNGTNMCVPCDTTASGTSKVDKKTNEDGSSEETTTEKKTECTGNKCTTKETETKTNKDSSGNPTGTVVTSRETTQGKDEFCRDNPKHASCKGDSDTSWGGSCESGFTCNGDAVMCAMSRELHRQSCELNKATPESELYGEVKSATGNQTEDAPGNATIAFGSSYYSDADLIGGAACISDLPLTLSAFGRTLIDVTLPLSDICPYLLWLKAVLLFCSAIAWLYIVFLRE